VFDRDLTGKVAARRVKMGEGIPPLPVSCLAEYVTRGGRSPESILRPYKFRDRGEGLARIVFRPPVVTVIRNYYKLNSNSEVFDSAIADWQKRADATDKKSLRAKLHSNVIALNLFRRHYQDKDFTVLPLHRISCQIGPVVFTALPDLWVKVKDRELLIKIGFGKKNRSYVDIVLLVMRRAALIHGHRIRQHDAVYLNVRTGEELVGRFAYKLHALTLATAASEIAEVWPRVAQLGTLIPLAGKGAGAVAHTSGGH
jgi:hypothetical protein